MSNMRLNQFCLPDNVCPIELNWIFAPRLIHRYVTIIRYFIGLIINQMLQSLASNIDFFFCSDILLCSVEAPQSLKLFYCYK